jgi:hypothetical protein
MNSTKITWQVPGKVYLQMLGNETNSNLKRVQDKSRRAVVQSNLMVEQHQIPTQFQNIPTTIFLDCVSYNSYTNSTAFASLLQYSFVYTYKWPLLEKWDVITRFWSAFKLFINSCHR